MSDSVDQILNQLQPGKFDATRAANFDIERAKGALQSVVSLKRDGMPDRNARTVDLALATDQPIEHWFGMLELDVSKGAVVLDRVDNGIAPLLVNHDRDQLAGVIVAGSVKLGPIVRGTVKFSRSQLGEDMLNDVEDEVRIGTSVGFLVHDMILVSNKDGEIPVYRATKWEILEVSLAAVPADIGCGVGRSFEKPHTAERDGDTDDDPEEQCPNCEAPMDECECEEGERQVSKAQKRANPTTTEKTMTPEEKAAAEAEARNVKTPEQLAREAKVAVVGEITELGRVLNLGDVATEYLRDAELAENGSGPTIEAFKAFARAKQPASIKVPGQDPTTIARQNGVQLARTAPRYGTLRNFTGEDAAERAMRFGNWVLAARGIEAGKADRGAFARAAKFCQDHGIDLSRAMSEGVNESGGFLVPEEFANDLIDLREQYGVFRRNAKMVPMASDTRSDPRRTGGLTAYFEGEGDGITASDKNWDRVSLTAKKLAVLARYSSEVNEDAMINFADDLAGEIAYAFALKEDQCGFIGDGTSTYGGIQGVCTKIKGLSGTIANIAGLVVGSGNAYSEQVLADFEAVAGKLPVYADTPNAKWYCHKSFYWNVMVKLALAAGGATGSETTSGVAKRFLGYDVEFVQVMPSVEANSQVCALLGDLSLAASFGSRRDTSIAISEHSRFANDQIEIRGTERFDINVHDVGNASGTAGLRVPGPIVGLITAAS